MTPSGPAAGAGARAASAGRTTIELRDHPLLAPLVAARPGLRVVGHPDAFEAAVATVLGQQVSLGAARTFAGRLVAAFGTPGPGGLTRFPTPAELAAADVDDLRERVGLTGARARTVHALATAVAGGLDLGGDPAEARAALLALPGIGPWTVDFLAVRVFGDRDAFCPGDLVLRRALGVTAPREAERLAEPWRPDRALALVHLWTDASYLGPA